MTVCDISTEGMDIEKVTLYDFIKKSGMKNCLTVPVTIKVNCVFKDLVKIFRTSGAVNESLML